MGRTLKKIVVDDFSGGIVKDASYLLDKKDAVALTNIGQRFAKRLSKTRGFSRFGSIENFGVEEFSYPEILGNGSTDLLSNYIAFEDDTNSGPFGRISSFEKLAQKFIAPSTNTIVSVAVKLYKTGTPADNVELEIWDADTNGFPNAVVTNGDSAPALAMTSISGSIPGGWHTFTFSTPPSVTKDAIYYIHLSRSGALNNTNYPFWRWDASDPYVDGFLAAYDASAWDEYIDGSEDALFRLTFTDNGPWVPTYDGDGASTDDLTMANGIRLKIKSQATTTAKTYLSLVKGFGIATKKYVFEIKIKHIDNENNVADGLMFVIDNGVAGVHIRFRSGNVQVYDNTAASWTTLTTFNNGQTRVYQLAITTAATPFACSVTTYKDGNNVGTASFTGADPTVAPFDVLSAGDVALEAYYRNEPPSNIKLIDVEIDFMRFWPMGEILAVDVLRTGDPLTDYYFAIIPGEDGGANEKGVLHKYNGSTDEWEVVASGAIFTIDKKTHTIQINNELYFFNGTDNVQSVDSSGTITDRTVPANGIPLSKYAVVSYGRLFVAGNNINSNRVYYSDAGTPNTFTGPLYWDVGAGAASSSLSVDNDYITALSRVKSEIIVGRASSIWSLVLGGAGFPPTSCYPISESIGMVSNRAVVYVGNDIIYLSSDKEIRTVVRTAEDTFTNDILKSRSLLKDINVSLFNLPAMVILSPFMWFAFPNGTDTYNSTVYRRNLSYGSYSTVSKIRPVLFKSVPISNEDVLFMVEDHIAKILQTDATVYNVDGISMPANYRSPEFEFEDISTDKVLKRLGVVVEDPQEDIVVSVRYGDDSDWIVLGTLAHKDYGGLTLYDDYEAEEVDPIILQEPYPVLKTPSEVKVMFTDDRRRWRKIQIRLRSNGDNNKDIKINQWFLEAMIKNRRTDY